jgi:hypothetical protein
MLNEVSLRGKVRSGVAGDSTFASIRPKPSNKSPKMLRQF